MSYGDSWKHNKKFEPHKSEEEREQRTIEDFGKINKEDDKWFYGKDREDE